MCVRIIILAFFASDFGHAMLCVLFVGSNTRKEVKEHSTVCEISECFRCGTRAVELVFRRLSVVPTAQ